jgi:hypothetical protein
VRDRDAPYKTNAPKSNYSFFETLKPNFISDATKAYTANITPLKLIPKEIGSGTSRNGGDNLRFNLSQALGSSPPVLKYDGILDKAQFMKRALHNGINRETLHVHESQLNLSELMFNGAIPDDQYIKLPRIMYNMPERNPHLSNHRPEKGKIHIRSFRIPKYPD